MRHLSQFERLTEASLDFPRLANLCFALPEAQLRLNGDVHWLDAANRLLDMNVSKDIWIMWFARHKDNARLAYRMAIGHMILGDCDNVITSLKELENFHDRYDYAIAMRLDRERQNALQLEESPVLSNDADQPTPNEPAQAGRPIADQ